MFSFYTHKLHFVLKLPVHTADLWEVAFEEGWEEEGLAIAEGNTKLTGWFNLNQ